MIFIFAFSTYYLQRFNVALSIEAASTRLLKRLTARSAFMPRKELRRNLSSKSNNFFVSVVISTDKPVTAEARLAHCAVIMFVFHVNAPQFNFLASDRYFESGRSAA
jgi:hypothetical protein